MEYEARAIRMNAMSWHEDAEDQHEIPKDAKGVNTTFENGYVILTYLEPVRFYKESEV